MQVLKEEVRNSIIKAAKHEFRQNGFKNSSMRSIAKKSGMTVGNLYRYFNNKEDLFHTVVSPAFNKIIKLIDEEVVSVLGKDMVAEYATKRIIEIHSEHREELLILINGSKGTNYEGGKIQLISLVEKRINRLFDDIRKDGVVIEDDFLARAIAVSYVEGFIIILNNYKDVDKISKQIELYGKFAFKDIKTRFK